MRCPTIAAAALIASGLVPSAGQTSSVQTPDAAQKFSARSATPLTTYRAVRRLEAANPRFRKHGWMDVRTEVTAAGFSYVVLGEGGSDMVRRKVLYPTLEGERDLWRGRTTSALTEANYVFADAGVENNLARIRITPRRKDKYLVDGWLLVAPDGAGIVELRGRLAKAPSFWTTRVEVLRRQACLTGVWVPVLVESTASVRFAGASTFSMRYTYETINGVPVAR